MKNIYGYINSYNGSFIEIGFTEKGAKIAATKDQLLGGFDVDELVVGYRSYINNMFIETSKKINGSKWIKTI